MTLSPLRIRKWSSEEDQLTIRLTRALRGIDASTVHGAVRAFGRALSPAPAVEVHNEHAGRLVGELWELAERDPVRLNVLMESLLLGAAMLNWPGDGRRQALLVQEIADGAADRAKAIR